ncbi:MAG: PF20097 family protein [Acetatifactor sp.]|jgi:hypothetical protein|nr:PF20097 family protein [Acetatifactor sp.]
MKCPFCDKEMTKGFISGDGRSGVFWNNETEKISLMDKLVGVGKVTAAKHSLTQFKIDANYCPSCKKMIFDTDISK